jgi:hypothetical protein
MIWSTLLPVFLKSAPILAGLAGLANALWVTAVKFRTRSDLSRALNANSSDIVKVRAFLDANKVDAAVDLVKKYAVDLPSNERQEAESALNQTSERGRASYMRTLSAAPWPSDEKG